MLEQIVALGPFETVIFVILALIIAAVGVYVLWLVFAVTLLYAVYFYCEKPVVTIGTVFLCACLGMWFLLR
jgi:hypothetical protein